MENTISQLSAENLEIKLTNEKILITTPTSNQTFALRSVNGIGVVDLVDDYNKALTVWRDKAGVGPIFYVFAGILAIGGIWAFSLSPILSIFTVLISVLFARIGYIQTWARKRKINEPKLMSAVRIMMNSGNIDFQFDKTGIISGDVAEFVAKVESTLTGYNKNNY